MKFTATSVLLAAATVASAVSSAADLSTISRTSIHTSCPSSAATKAYYGNSTLATSESDVIQYETDLYTKDATITLVSTSCSADRCEVTTILNSLTTVVATVDGVLTTYVTGVPITPSSTAAAATATAPYTTVVTITSCHHNACHETAVTTGATVVTSEVDGVKTVYTTFCPLSGESSVAPETASTSAPASSPAPTAPVTVTKPATTVITITSCENDKCHETPVTTGVSTYSTTINGVVTAYTTYCPLSTESEATSETAVETSAPATTSTVQESLTSESTVNVITNNIVTELASATSSAVISTYEGAAHRAVPAVLALPALYLLL